jgi:hypothetical protein
VRDLLLAGEDAHADHIARGEPRGQEQHSAEGGQGRPQHPRGALKVFQAFLIHEHIAHARQTPQAFAHFRRPAPGGEVCAEAQFQALWQGFLARAFQQQTRLAAG